MKEKDFQRMFAKRNKVSGVFELKICKTNTFLFDAVKEHQREALKKVMGSEGFFHKITDVPVSAMQEDGSRKMRFTKQKPFDCFLARDFPAYVVIGFYEARKYWRVLYLNINQFLALESRYREKGKKSIRKDDPEVVNWSEEWPVGNK